LLDEHSARIDFSIGEKDGYTPMHGAGFQGRADIARLLIAAGLDPSDRHKVGMQPSACSLQHAAFSMQE
jgi:ankyrin repeat protein